MKLLRREGLPKRASLVYGFLGAATVWTGKLNHTLGRRRIETGLRPSRPQGHENKVHCTVWLRPIPKEAQADHHREPSGPYRDGDEVEEFIDLMQWLNAPEIVHPQG